MNMWEYIGLKNNVLVAVLLLSGFNTWAQKDTTPTTGYLDFNGYNDTRHFAVLTINLMSNIHHRVQYFSLTNYQGAKNTSDLNSLYSEQNVRWAFRKNSPIDLTLQYVLRSNNGNDDLKFGIRWKLSQSKPLVALFKKMNTFYSINPMFVQFQEHVPTKYMTTIEHVYAINLFPKALNKRLYVSGFADQNFVYANNSLIFKWVSEHQVGIRMIDNVYLVAEFRINNYAAEQVGVGYGVEYKITY